ncbi:hypothetical protein CTAYLR_000371 [Chrysophaeum taylorii]|uniref:Sulphur transport domain-containing protein n=1 Tax=Chrysophaeum taylorii TaxID=2483200 RepID=A0AAD7UG30_9STRA|nr:hypothetical protein CTAYLR_000371 [Chrysophaeum taylorii]
MEKEVVVGMLCGIVMGVAFEKSRVLEPEEIRSQMSMKSFIMMKIFLSAVAASSASLLVLSLVAPSRVAKCREGVSGATKSKEAGIVGGLLLGAGITISGACCPGIVLAQVGSGKARSLVTFVGCLAGALAHSVVEPAYRKAWPKMADRKAARLMGSWRVAVTISTAICAVAVYAIEKAVPWRAEAERALGRPLGPEKGQLFFTAAAWRPQTAGALIGGLQVPLVGLISQTLGTSSAYVTLVGTVVDPTRPGRADLRAKVGQYWQVALVSGVSLGAFLSSKASGLFLFDRGAVGLGAAFFGGALLVFGARVAGGCTSENGISGVSCLSETAFYAVGAMFAGAVATRLFLSSFLRTASHL